MMAESGEAGAGRDFHHLRVPPLLPPPCQLDKDNVLHLPSFHSNSVLLQLPLELVPELTFLLPAVAALFFCDPPLEQLDNLGVEDARWVAEVLERQLILAFGLYHFIGQGVQRPGDENICHQHDIDMRPSLFGVLEGV